MVGPVVVSMAFLLFAVLTAGNVLEAEAGIEMSLAIVVVAAVVVVVFVRLLVRPPQASSDVCPREILGTRGLLSRYFLALVWDMATVA